MEDFHLLWNSVKCFRITRCHCLLLPGGIKAWTESRWDWHTHKLTCFWDTRVQSLRLAEALTITGSPLFQPIRLGSRAPCLPCLGAWGWGRGAALRNPIPLCCLLGPLSLETHSRGVSIGGDGDGTTWLQISETAVCEQNSLSIFW